MLGSPYIALAVVFVMGLILFGIGTALRHPSEREAAAASSHITWTRIFDDEAETPDVATRLDMIERMAMLHEPWCLEALRIAAREERHRDLKRAARKALR